MNGSYGLYRVEATSKNPKQSKQYLTAVVNEALNLSRPVGSDRSERLEQIRMLENNISNLRNLYGKLAAAQAPQDTTNIEQIPSTLYSIENDISEKEVKLSSLKRGLEGPSSADVLEWPSEPEAVGGKVATAVIAALATLILTIVLLYTLFLLSSRNETRPFRNATR
ncbi:hypothetical protein X566_17625 [Afipia sp. P52-10]|nr:hypothetical protein X566_17625 [Afipia sp. P52-10]